MLALYRTLSWRYLQKRWSRAALVVASIALGVATLVATRVLNASMLSSAQRATAPLAGTADLLVSNGDAGVRRDLVHVLSKVPGVYTVAPLVIERVAIVDLDNRPALLVGADMQPNRSNPWGLQVSEGALPAYVAARLQGQQPALVGQELAQALSSEQRQFRIRAAGKVCLLSRVATVDASGPAASLGGNVVYVDSAAAAQLLDRPGFVTRLDVAVDPRANREEVQARIEAAVAGQALVRTPERLDQPIQDVMAGLQIGFAMGGTGALVIGLFLVYNVLSVSVAERRHEIGILRSLGATRSQVWSLFVGEAAVLGLAGTALGLPAGRALAELGLGPLVGVVSDFFVAVEARHVEVTPLIGLEALAAGLLTTFLAALIPAVRAAQEQPAEAVRRIPAAPQLRQQFMPLAGSLLLLAAGTVCVVGRQSLPARWGSFGGLTLFLLGALLLTPRLAGGLAWLVRPLARRFLSIEGRLAADNLVRSPGRTGLVITALAAGVAMVMQTAGLIRSNEDVILPWIDQTLTADLVVSSASDMIGGGQNQPLAADVGRRIATLPGVEAALAVRVRQVEFRDQRVFLEAIDPGFHRAGRQGAVAGLERFPDLADPGVTNVLISENFAALYRVRPGETLTLHGPHGLLPVRVIGTVIDYSWNRGSVMMDLDRYREHFEDPLVDIFDVYLRPETDPAAIAETIARRWGAENALVVMRRQQLRELFEAMIHRLYGIAYSQEAVVAVVAALGVLTALLISVIQRRHELGLLRAVGATRGQVLASVLAEAALMGLLGLVIGLGVGLALEWYCLHVLLLEEAGVLFPVRVAWRETGLIAGAALVIATLAGLGPALHTSRMRIPEAIAYE
jgi:putative ABC transport system permease protein